MTLAGLPEVLYRRQCPFCRRLQAYLLEKGLQARLLEFHPDRDMARLRALNPKAQVPTWREGDLTLFESFIIMQYLEESHPEPSLAPATAAGWARTRLLYDLSDTVCTPSMLGFVRVPPDHPSRPQHRDDLVAHSAAIAALLDSVGPFALGARFTLADLSLPPLLFRGLEKGLSPDALPPRIRRWGGAVLARAALTELFPSVRLDVVSSGESPRPGG
jgi:stringent starvation protein A